MASILNSKNFYDKKYLKITYTKIFKQIFITIYFMSIINY